MASLTPFVFLLSICLSGVVSQDHVHAHPKQVTSEKYAITVKLSTPNGKPPTIKWDITKTHRAAEPDIEVIAQALNIWAHSNNKAGQFVGHGYQGLEIDHYVNGKHIHTFNLPKCIKPRLGKAIIERTSGQALSDPNKKYLVQAINSCQGSA